jgi:hypothetical protein
MAIRTALLLSFLAGVIFGAAALWLLKDSPTPSEMAAPRSADQANTPSPAAMASRAESPSSLLKECSENFERSRFELERERDTVAQLREELETRCGTALQKPPPVLPQQPPPTARRGRRAPTTSFDAGRLAASGFSPDDIEWIRGRWEHSEAEKRDREARGEARPRSGTVSGIEQELRQDLGDSGYDAMLYATHQGNRVKLERVRGGSVASEAGLQNGDVVWSYDGQRVFAPKELAALSTSGDRGELVEIVIVAEGEKRHLSVERNPLGAELISAKERPIPN